VSTTSACGTTRWRASRRGGAALASAICAASRPAWREIHFGDVERGATSWPRRARARALGFSGELVVDPASASASTRPTTSLLANLAELKRRVGLPVLVGPSRKAFLGELTGDEVAERDLATAIVSGIAVFTGADALRVHDASAARRAVALGAALRAARRADA
jgi:dihydropteroate synthase